MPSHSLINFIVDNSHKLNWTFVSIPVDNCFEFSLNPEVFVQNTHTHQSKTLAYAQFQVHRGKKTPLNQFCSCVQDAMQLFYLCCMGAQTDCLQLLE